jgi:hypothetical protein
MVTNGGVSLHNSVLLNDGTIMFGWDITTSPWTINTARVNPATGVINTPVASEVTVVAQTTIPRLYPSSGTTSLYWLPDMYLRFSRINQCGRTKFCDDWLTCTIEQNVGAETCDGSCWGFDTTPYGTDTSSALYPNLAYTCM